MGEIMDILKGVPLSDSTVKQIIVMEEKIAILEAENAEFKAKIKALKIDEDVCRHCRKPKGKFISVGRSKEFPQIVMQAKFYKCADCGQEYEKPYQP